MLLFRLAREALKSDDFRLLLGLTGAVVAAGTVFFHFQEGLRWLDAVYFTVITLTTVGYGDIAPQTDAGKLFTIAYLVVGLGIIAAFIGVVSEIAVSTGGSRRPNSRAVDSKGD